MEWILDGGGGIGRPLHYAGSLFPNWGGGGGEEKKTRTQVIRYSEKIKTWTAQDKRKKNMTRRGRGRDGDMEDKKGPKKTVTQ